MHSITVKIEECASLLSKLQKWEFCDNLFKVLSSVAIFGSIRSAWDFMKTTHCTQKNYLFIYSRWKISAIYFVHAKFSSGKLLIAFFECYSKSFIKSQIILLDSRVRNNYSNEYHIIFFMTLNVWIGWHKKK